MKRSCDACGIPYIAKRANSRFCSDTCRKRGQRGQSSAAARDVEPSQSDSDIVRVTRSTLEAAGRLDTVAGASAMELARSIPNSGDSAKAGLVRELRAAVSQATAGAEPVEDEVSRARRLRDEKRRAAGS